MNPVRISHSRKRPGTGHLVPGTSATSLGALTVLALLCGQPLGPLGPGARSAGAEPAPAAPPAPPAPEDRKQLIREQRERYEAGVAFDPPLDDRSHRTSDLFQLQLQNDRLVIAPHIPATPLHEARKVQIEGIPSPATIVYVASLGRRAGMARARFDFSAEKFDEDSGVYSRLRVMTYYRNLRLSQAYRSADTQWDVSLEESGEDVRLSVSGTASGNPIESVNVSESDLMTLRRRHPRETDRWLRPMLRELGQERLLAPDPQAAWQVLADDWPEDPKVRQAVLKALPDLGAADFHVREAAERKIAELGLSAATTIRRLDKEGVRADLSAEQNRELDAVVSLHRVYSTDEAAVLHDDPEFLLDCLGCEDLTARSVALHRLQQLTQAASGFDAKDINANPDRRATAIATLREKVMTETSATTKPSR